MMMSFAIPKKLRMTKIMSIDPDARKERREASSLSRKPKLTKMPKMMKTLGMKMMDSL